MSSNPNIRIGCSGWQYQHWRADFYPAELPASRWLDYYAERFDTVEINNTFFTRATKLGASLGPVLHQLPPRWPVNIERLASFLRALPRRHRHVVEFREPSWYRDASSSCSSAMASHSACTTWEAPPRAG